ncbi:hypothetical protein [Pseudomaricurvus sp.]|uniref:hypothetical protein n=1 Tax=Pseudomaricurvus sp. TaxID=2004510 RepID=UPI003F6B9AB7
MKHTLKYALLVPLCLATLASFTITTSAETIRIPVGQQSSANVVAKPTMGLSMDQVEEQFGEPVKRNPARGQPPITRWEYEQFVVYFEDNTVIHSVARFKPAQTDNITP